MHALLAKLGNPQLGRRTVHVTGSKGKGSTSVFLAAMLGVSAPVSLYTSPHLHSYRERICFNLNPVSCEDFASGVSAIQDAVLEEHRGALGPVSTFGAMTCLYFYLSRSSGMQWQVVEVGMGGRYDATNIFARKELVLITAISLEHTNMLGKSTGEIAENKAGIIRPGCIVVLAPQKDPQVPLLIAKKCLEQNADFIDVAQNYEITPASSDGNSQSFMISCASRARRCFKIRMLGEHQLDNAATAVAALDALAELHYLKLSSSEMQEALMSVFVPGRLEIMQSAPRVIIDGAHNGESATALVKGLRWHFDAKEAVFVLGVNSDKNIHDILASIKSLCARLVITSSRSEKAMDPAIIAEAAQSLAMDYLVIAESQKAVEKAVELAGPDGLVCATGSLYVVAEVREYFLGADPSWSLAVTQPGASSTVLRAATQPQLEVRKQF
jgi:dihydrofolate synthase / folylpolyglutamate synthase